MIEVFRFKFKKSYQAEPESFLNFLGHPDSSLLIQFVKEEKWSELDFKLQSYSEDELHPLLDGLTEVVTDWRRDEWPYIPENGRLILFKGYFLVAKAWIERTGQRAEDVTEEQFRRFFRALDQAEALLGKYIESNPSESLAYLQLFRVYMGQSYETDDKYQLFIKYSKSTNEHLAAHIKMAYSLTEQWGGSHRDLFSFCRVSYKQNPRFAPLIAYAHFMRWFYDALFEEGELDDTYFMQPEVEGELVDAHEAYSKIDIPTYEKLIGENYFAFCFAKSSKASSLKKALMKVDRHILSGVWDIEYENEFNSVNSLRSYCGLKKIR